MNKKHSFNFIVVACLLAVLISAISVARFDGIRCQATPIGADWDRTFGGSGTDGAVCVQQTSDSGFIIAGNTNSHTPGRAWLIKTDASGSQEWANTYGGVANCVQEAADGGYVLAGTIQSDDPEGGKDGWLMKTNSSGEEVWSHKFSAPVLMTPDHPFWPPYKGDDEIHCVQQTSDNGFVIAGHAWVTPGDYSAVGAWIMKTDSSGNMEWDNAFDAYDSPEEAYCVDQTSDGGYILAGKIPTGEATSLLLIKTDSSGGKVWDRTSSAWGSDIGNSVEQTADGGYIIAGSCDPDNGKGIEVLLLKTDSSGTEQWYKTFGENGNDRGYSVQQTADNGFIIAAETGSYTSGGQDAWLIKTDASGVVLWDKVLGGPQYDGAYSIDQTSDGGFVIAGTTYSYGAGGADAWIIKVHEPPSIPNQPSNVSPSDGAVDVSVSPVLHSSAFSDPDAADTHVASQWQLSTISGAYLSPILDITSSVFLTSIKVVTLDLDLSTSYFWRVRYQDSHLDWSRWSEETSFTTVNLPPNQPSNVSPSNGATGLTLTPTLSSSGFSDPDAGDVHAASQWQVRTSTGSYGTPVYDSATDSRHGTSITMASGLLNYSTTYYWHVRHQDNHGYWSGFSAETSFTTGPAPDIPPNQPSNVSPSDGAIDISVTPTLQSSAFSDPHAGDTHVASQWQISTTPSDYSSPVFDITSSVFLTSLKIGVLDDTATYYWHIRHQDNHGYWSDYSVETSFTTGPAPNNAPNQPSNVSPSNGATGLTLTPTLSSSGFSDPDAGDIHAASQWQITTTAGNYSSPAFNSGIDTSNLTSSAIPSGTLNYSTCYYWRMRHQDSYGNWSAWSAETSFNVRSAPAWDINQDGKVDYKDLAILGAHYGETSAPPYPAWDINQDGKVDYKDLATLGAHYGEVY